MVPLELSVSDATIWSITSGLAKAKASASKSFLKYRLHLQLSLMVVKLFYSTGPRSAEMCFFKAADSLKHCPIKDKLQLTGPNLGSVFNSI